MTDTSPQAAPERKPGKHDNGRQPEPQPHPDRGRPAEDRVFTREDSPIAELIAPNPMTMGTVFEVEHEAVQFGQEMIRASQQAFDQTMDVWRRSLEPLATTRVGMSRWYEDFVRQATGFGAVRPLRTARPFAGGPLAAVMGGPAVDLKELDEAYRLDIEVPGLDAGDLDLCLKGDLLIISGHKAEAIDGGAYQISERRYGRFERAVPLPGRVDRDRIEAQLENGVLAITLPKMGGAVRPRRKIQIRQ